MKKAEILLDVYSDIIYGCKFNRCPPWWKERVIKAVLKSIEQTIDFMENGRVDSDDDWYEMREFVQNVKVGKQEIGKTN